MKKTLKLILVIFFCFQFNKTQAQYTDVINSNRPGASQSAFSVGTKVLQFELGSYFVREKRKVYPNYKVSGYGVDFDIHYGFLKEALELNIQGVYQNDTKSFNSNANTNNKRSNFKNFNIGAKYMIFDPNKNKENKPNIYSYHANRGFKLASLIPAVSVSAGVNFDSKNNPYTSSTAEGVSFRGTLITQNNFYGGWVFVTNFMIDRIGSEQTDLSYILTLTHSINTKWVIFGETQGIKSDFYADNLFRMGAGYLLNKNLQLDSALCLNNKDTPSVLNINFGVSYRIDSHDILN